MRHLEVTEAVQRLGSVTGAARALHLTQPAVSHALREIERRLEVELVKAQGRGIRVTAAGERLARRARAILAALDTAEDEARDTEARNGGRLRLTTECYTCYHWLPRALAELRRRLPRLQLELVPEATRRPFAALLAREVDLAIVSSPDEHPEIVRTPLFGDELVALVHPDHRLARRPYAVAEDFAGEHLVLIAEPEHSTVILSVLAPAGVTPARVSQLHLTEAVVETVKAGLGVTVMARWAVSPQLRAGELRAVPVTEAGLLRHWWAAHPRGAQSRVGVGELIDVLRESGLG
jgi:LysR family transcriptional regulator, regulator for metE and metH